jgi:hypothetical protein
MDDINADAKGGGYRRVEVLTGLGRRRKWSGDEKKARIVSETDPPPLKWSALRYGFEPEEDQDGEQEAEA